MFDFIYRGKTVWLSGHTGFKGSWLAQWLVELGAQVHGFALPAPTQPALFEQLDLAPRIRHELGDVRDAGLVRQSILEAQPDFVFHLAAQPLVRTSYAQPVETYATNVMGTVHVLAALRELGKACTAVVVTSDKCYENREWVHGYREEDALGGHDPYSSSKAVAELAASSFRRSFFQTGPVRVATARAGNVIGGGDWALDRIVPDCIRALQQGRAIPVRNRFATRPWQHVLEPLGGYLWLAARLAQAADGASPLASAFNFGPGPDGNRTVRELVELVLRHWPGSWEDQSDPKAVHEAAILQLSTDKARALLGWNPVWNFATGIEKTVSWYRAASADAKAEAILSLTSGQIAAYAEHARAQGLPWAIGGASTRQV